MEYWNDGMLEWGDGILENVLDPVSLNDECRLELNSSFRIHHFSLLDHHCSLNESGKPAQLLLAFFHFRSAE